MIKAIKELENNNIIFNDIKKYIKSDETLIENNILYYKTIYEGLILLNNKDNTNIIKPNIENFGIMLDLSRGAVFNISYIKRLIRSYALMGISEIWLYLENNFHLDNYPTFGYFRGSYSKDEIKEIVLYASLFDIEIIPAIQVLGHQEQFLRWPNSANYKDQDKVLLANDEKTLNLIKELIKFTKENFNTKRIHIGMDETFGLGFGQYYKKFGFKNPLDIFNKHLKEVNNYALSIGYNEVMIWSDMYFRFLSETEYYYDTNIKLDENIINKIPNNVTLVYWDYYNHNKQIVEGMVKNHLLTNKKIVFASGTWIWTRLNYDKKQTDRTAKMHLEVSIENKLNDFILTQWMDDGAYGIHDTTNLGVYELSLINYNLESNKKSYYNITKNDINIDLDKTKLNNTRLSQVGLLWDDPLYSIYLHNFNDEKSIIDEQQLLVNLYNKNDHLFEYLISNINYLKILSKFNLIEAYKNNQINNDLIENYNSIITLLKELNIYYRSYWHQNYKSFGLEIIQGRIYQQIVRMEEVIFIINNYKNGDKLDFLEIDYIKEQYLSLKHNDIAHSTKIF